MRSEGQVRFITLTSRVQMIGAVIALALLAGWAVSVAGAAWFQWQSQSERSALLMREARVATAQERVDAYRADIDAVADDLERRQDFIDAMWDAVPADVKGPAPGSKDRAHDNAAKTAAQVSTAIPEASALARIEARQISFVEGLTSYADIRAERAAAALRTLGLNPGDMLRQDDRSAMGGPFEELAAADSGLDPRFERLGESLARLDALERFLDGVPQVTPANLKAITSSFGYRRDPLNNRAAMHRGVDFRGAIGAAIYAAADGRVSFVGRKGGYGNVVEVRHGNGLLTRYAHMSQFAARVGDKVEAGQVIGAIGNTGRSTGPHLHFEVHLHNRAINPRPFLETAPHVLKEARTPLRHQSAG